MSTVVERLCGWVEACLYDLSRKLGHAVGQPQDPTAQAFLRHADWHRHQRLEANVRADRVTRGVICGALREPADKKLERVWATRVLLNRRGALQEVGTAYRRLTGRGIFQPHLELEALASALGKVRLDNAYAGMRRAQWSQETRSRYPKGDPRRRDGQRACMARTWVRLRQEDAFKSAVKALGEAQRAQQRGSFRRVLRTCLSVHSDFIAMIMARDLEVLLAGVVTPVDVTDCTVVGGGARAVVREFAGELLRSTDHKRMSITDMDWLGELHKLLEARLRHSIYLPLVCPQGWTLDLTENACCELRRWEGARCHRTRNLTEQDRRNHERAGDFAVVWRHIGLPAPPPLCERPWPQGTMREVHYPTSLTPAHVSAAML
jgi:hypothetical protein